MFEEFLHYRAEKDLGGNMARVYRAFDKKNVRYVALKLIPLIADKEPEIKAEENGARQQEVMSDFDPRVPKIYEHGAEDGYFYIAMEYIEGEDLSKKIKHSTVSTKSAVNYTIEICKLVETAKRQGIIHGDLKPGNIRITPDDQVKVLDFGISKSLSGIRTSTSQTFRSVPYSSPERLKDGQMSVDSDLWSVGVMLYEMISGHKPFPGKDDQEMDRFIQNYSSLSALKLLPPNSPDALRSVIWKALAPRPSDRYSNPEAFRSDLERFLRGERTVAESEFEETPTTRTGEPLSDTPPTRPFTRPIQLRVAAAEPDPPTRRTAPQSASSFLESDPPTRRTSPQSAPAPSPVRIPTVRDGTTEPVFLREGREPKAPVFRPAAKPFRIWQWLFALVVILALGYAGLNEYNVINGIKALEPEIEGAGSLADIQNSYATYRAMVGRSLFARAGWVPGLDSLRSKLVKVADKEPDRYRTNPATVRKNNWQQAELCLRWALELGRDTECEAKQYYCEGHISRISDQPLEAVRKFEAAAQLKPNWPDPYIGLAHIYSYDLKDPEKATEMRQKAESMGHTRGKREIAQEADNCLLLSQRFYREALQQKGQPDEEAQLNKAKENCLKAIELYNLIIPYSNAGANKKLAQKIFQQADERLTEIKGEAPEPKQVQ